MSNALAVAHVTQALALLIESNLRPEIDMAVSVETRKPPAEPPLEPTITVFLYQVTHNPSMRNYELPTRASDGKLLNKPVAALDLHYVISAYGEENELVGQRLIGCVARILREFPVLPADVIQEAGERPYLAGSNLAEAEQKVRFTPLQMDIDETSKLWGMLHQTPYALSMTYQGSLVLVEGREEPERSRPVERTVVTVGASGTPHGSGGAGVPGAPGAPGVSVAPEGAEDAAGRAAGPADPSGSPGSSGTGSGDGGPAGPGPEGSVQARGAGTAQRAAAKKTAAARQSAAARQTAASQTPATKGAARQSAAKQAGARQAAGGRGAAKQATAKQAAAKKAAAEKAAAAKVTAKKSTAAKATAKKATARKQTGGGRPAGGAAPAGGTAGGGARNSGTDNTSDGEES